jgi:hypothetical protein
MTTAVFHDGLWKEPQVIYAKHDGVFKEVAAPALRLIGAQYVSSNSLTLTPWETLKEGDLIVLFAGRNDTNGAISTPAGFTQIKTTSVGTSDRLSAFFQFVGDTPIAAITAPSAQTLHALVYRGAAGIGVSAQNVVAGNVATQTVTVAVLTEGSLVAAGTPFVSQLAGPSGALNLGFSRPNGAGIAATTLGPVPSTTTSLTPSFTMTSATRPTNMIAVEILTK